MMTYQSQAISRSTLGKRIVMVSGLIIIGIGLFFIFIRPAFLPEDLNYMGVGESAVALIPRLALWLRRVFIVLGGFIIATGAFAIGSSFVPQSRWIQVTAWATSLGLMTAVNFVIHSDFRFALLALAVLWMTGIILQWR